MHVCLTKIYSKPVKYISCIAKLLILIHTSSTLVSMNTVHIPQKTTEKNPHPNTPQDVYFTYPSISQLLDGDTARQRPLKSTFFLSNVFSFRPIYLFLGEIRQWVSLFFYSSCNKFGTTSCVMAGSLGRALCGIFVFLSCSSSSTSFLLLFLVSRFYFLVV